MPLCNKCSEIKQDVDFYDGFLNASGSGVCKKCHAARVRARRLTHPEARAYDRKRATSPERRAKSRRVADKWRTDHPEAYRAHNALNNALRDGKIKKQPCQICGSNEHVHAHHTDYSRPLDVKWLCARCHHRIHATFPELGGHDKEQAQP